jgi:hypothetical protein
MASELTCTYCGKEFKKKAKLAEHTLSHTGEVRYSDRGIVLLAPDDF